MEQQPENGLALASGPAQPLRVVSLLATAILSLGAASSAWADGKGNAENPDVLPPHSQPYGKSYGEWAAKWWQWAMSIPADRNPLTDTTSTFAGEDQSGPVWFGAGTLGGSAERSFQMPTGKAIFLPVFNWIFGSGVFDCNPTVPGVPCCVPCLQATAGGQPDCVRRGNPLRSARPTTVWTLAVR